MKTGASVSSPDEGLGARSGGRARAKASGPASRRRGDLRFISDEPLSPYERHVRRELASWSSDIARQLAHLPPDPLERAAETVRAFQETALVAAYLDRPDEARMILHAALDFVAREAKMPDRAEAGVLGFGLLIELSRLDARLGRPDESLHVLERIGGLLRGQPLAFGALDIAPSDWQALAGGDASLEAILAGAIAIETLRAHLAAGRYEAALEASRAPAGADPVLETFRREAQIVASCRTGRGEEALAAAAQWPSENQPVRRAILEIRHAEALAALGDPVRAHAIVEEAAGRVERKLVSGPATLFDLGIATRATRLLALLGDPLAPELCHKALAPAAAVGDVPLLAELALRIVETDDREEPRADALEALRAVALGSGYRIPAVERAIEREDGPLVPRTVKERAPSYPALFARLVGFEPDRGPRAA
jgi:tetratricopeptide (TPR) repeat protein